MDSSKQSKFGRPKKSEEISLDTIIEIMLESATRGSFFCNLPAEIYLETKVMVSLSYLEKLKDEEFLRARSVASGVCFKYWTEVASQAAIPCNMWVFIAKNVAKWSDNKNVTIDGNLDQTITEHKESKEERTARFKKMLAEVV